MIDPTMVTDFWGGVPEGVRPAYTVSMLLATAGFFAYSCFLLFCVDPVEVRVAHRFGYRLFPVLYTLILVPSALWMPLTAALIDHGSAILWAAIRLVLLVVGVASVGLLAALVALRPRQPTWAYRLAVAGSVAFSIQTALLDAVVWVALFPA